MTNCIRDTPGTIGYIDSGHGHSEGLVEIELQNRDGSFLSSKEAGARGGIGAAAGAIPTSADEDFGGVDLLNQVSFVVVVLCCCCCYGCGGGGVSFWYLVVLFVSLDCFGSVHSVISTTTTTTMTTL